MYGNGHPRTAAAAEAGKGAPPWLGVGAGVANNILGGTWVRDAGVLTNAGTGTDAGGRGKGARPAVCMGGTCAFPRVKLCGLAAAAGAANTPRKSNVLTARSRAANSSCNNCMRLRTSSIAACSPGVVDSSRSAVTQAAATAAKRESSASRLSNNACQTDWATTNLQRIKKGDNKNHHDKSRRREKDKEKSCTISVPIGKRSGHRGQRRAQSLKAAKLPRHLQEEEEKEDNGGRQ